MNALRLALALSTTPADDTALTPPPPEVAATAARPAPPPHVTRRGAALDLDQHRPTVASLRFSPLATFKLGVVPEGEFRVHEYLTTCVVGEFYGAWMGWGAQAGLA